MIGRYADGDAARRADHVLQAERVGRLRPAQRREGSQHHAGTDHARDDPDQRGEADADPEAMDAQEPAHPKHGHKAQ